MSAQLVTGKTVAITGGSSGIGRAIALEMARHGANVAINYFPNETEESRAKTLGDEIAKIRGQGAFIAVAGDIGNPESGRTLVQKTVEAFGELNVFVSNAGICPFHEFTSMPEDVYYRTIKTNLDGAFFSTQAAAAQMKMQGKGGSIIGVSSISALVGGEFQAHYTTTKAGVLSLMQSCAVALGKYGIRCNALLPGTIETDINREDLADQEKRDYFNKRIPLGRLGQADDLAGPAVFLASDLSKYVTGAQILVDGGLFVNLQ
jgi:L-rhamnose 1-dehydrogenase